MLQLQLVSIVHSPLLVPESLHPKWTSFEIRLLPKNNESEFCRLLKTDLYRRGWAGAPLSRFLEGMPYKFLNE